MKSNFRLKHNDLFSLPENRQVMITVGELKNAFEVEYGKRVDKVFDSVKRDVSAQLMATVLAALHINFGFGKKRLKKVVRDTENLFLAMMDGGIMGRQLTTQNCIDLMREKYGIDVDARK